jgi:hypothetical protein
MREKIQAREWTHQHTANKNSLVCTADGKPDRQTTASTDGKQELLGLYRRWKIRPTNDRIGRRKTRTP